MSAIRPTGLRSLPDDRKVVLHTCYLVPTHAIWRTLLLPSVLVVLPGIVSFIFWKGSDLAGPMLQASLLSLGEFWVVHAAGMLVHRWNRKRWRVLEEVEERAEVVLKLQVPKGSTFIDFREDRWGVRRLTRACGEIAGQGLAESFLLLLLVPVWLWLRMHQPMEVQTLVRGEYGWGALVTIVSFLMYFPRCHQLLAVSHGLVSQFDMRVDVFPWKMIQKVVWKEPRYDGMQLEVQFVKGSYAFLSSTTVLVMPITPDKREAVLKVFEKYTTVETRWVEAGRVEVPENVMVEKEGVGGGR